MPVRGQRSLPSQCFQLETGNAKRLLDLPSSLQNLSPNYNKKTCTGAAKKNAPCRSFEQTSFMWKSGQGAEGSSDLNFWKRMVLSLPPAAGTAAGAVMWFSENHRFWHPMAGWKCWFTSHKYTNICMLPSCIFAMKILQTNWWKLCKGNNSSSITLPQPEGFLIDSWKINLKYQTLQKNVSCGLLDFYCFPTAHLQAICRLRAQIMESAAFHP